MGRPPLSISQRVLLEPLRSIFEGNEEVDNDEKVVSDLRSELWEKERKLTDIRLEALNSAHQLEQLQEAMTNMQVRGVKSGAVRAQQLYPQCNALVIIRHWFG